MIALAFGLIACLLVLAAAQGVRMLSTTGLEAAGAQNIVQERKKSGQFYGTIEKLGSRFTRATRTIYGPERLTRLENTIRAAGRPEGLTQATYLHRHTGFMVLGGALMVLMALNGQVLLGGVALALFAAWMPAFIRLSASDRRARIERDLPDFLDVLAVTVNAGTPFRPALARVRSHHEGPLSEEVGVALDEMALGVSRRAAFTGLRDRVGTDGVATFVTALLQAEELGVPLAQALTDISGEIRRERAQYVKQQAAKAASKVSLIVTMTIVPGSLILIVAVMVLQNADSLGALLQ